MTQRARGIALKLEGRVAALAVAVLGLATSGCLANPYEGQELSSSTLYASGTGSNAYGFGDGGATLPLALPPPVPSAPPAYPTPAYTPSGSTAPQLTPVTIPFAGNSGSKVHRVCSDNGAKRSRGSVYQAAGLVVVPVSSPNYAISPVMNDAPSGGLPSLSQVKANVASNGNLVLVVDKKQISANPTLYAVIAVGGGFGSPFACGLNIAPPQDGDAEAFKENSGVVGYFEAYTSGDGAQIVATPKSQLLWASNPKVEKSESGGWTGPSDGSGCDDYDSPLVLDLSASGSGIELGAQTNDLFDVDGDGTRDRLSWIASRDTPFLVLDANENGVVDGIDELFGNRTRSPNGARDSKNGFEALAVYDANGDGVIDRNDPVWGSLRLWFDRDRDGRTGPGELETLGARAIRSIAVGYASVSEGLFVGGTLEGAIRQRGAAYANDGRAISVVDVWFRR